MGFIILDKVFSKVDLPHPFGPIIDTTSPLFTLILKSSMIIFSSYPAFKFLALIILFISSLS